MPAAGAPLAAARPATAPGWRVRERLISLDRPVLLGVINVTPDSFSDGGDFVSPDAALRKTESLLEAGTDLIDIGGESTRPGAEPVSVADELRRMIPVVRAVRSRFPETPISVDTVKSDVARAALDEGVHAINDVSATRLDPRMAAVCAAAGAGLILMHSRGTVAEMASFAHAHYAEGVVAEVVTELAGCAVSARDAGVEAENIVLDPGIGFSKRSDHSLAVLAGVPALAALGYPVMIGVSRKRVIGEITGVSEPKERTMGTVGVNVVALASGARLFRVHDVRENRQALDAAWAVLRAGASPAANGE